MKWSHLKARLQVFAITYVVLMAAGLGVVVLIPSVYRAQAVIQVLKAQGEPTKLTTQDEPSYRKAVTSDNVLRAAADRLTQNAQPGSAGELETVSLLRRCMTVSVDPSKGWIEVAARSGNPGQAAACANAVAGAYIELEQKGNEEARKAFEPELARVEQLKNAATLKEKSLREAETALVAFDEESRTTLGNPDLVAARTELEHTIAEARTDQEAAKSLAVNEESLRKELAATPEFLELPATTTGPNPARTALEADIAREERELADLLKRFTEKHPLVIEKRSIVEQKKADLAKTEQKVSDTETRTRQTNPIYLQVKQNYDQARQKLQEANAKVEQQMHFLKEAQLRLGMLDERARKRTQLATEATRATAEANTAKKELADGQEHLQKLESSLVTTRLSQTAQRPTLPSGPERGWWTAVVFVTAVLGATVASFGAGLLGGSYQSAWEIERHLGLPMLGKISQVEEAERRKQWWAETRLLLTTGALLTGGVVVVVLLFAFEAQIHGLRMFLFGN